MSPVIDHAAERGVQRKSSIRPALIDPAGTWRTWGAWWGGLRAMSPRQSARRDTRRAALATRGSRDTTRDTSCPPVPCRPGLGDRRSLELGRRPAARGLVAIAPPRSQEAGLGGLGILEISPPPIRLTHSSGYLSGEDFGVGDDC